MPNTRSAAKHARASLRRRERNQIVATRLRSIQKRFQVLLEGGKKEEARALYPKVMSALDKAVKGGYLHANAANRRKARLGRRLAAS